MADLCKTAALRHHLSGEGGLIYSLFGDALVYSKVRSALGLERARYFFCAAAPLSEEVSRFFMGIDICLMDAFGMSECSGTYRVMAEVSSKLVIPTDSVGILDV